MVYIQHRVNTLNQLRKTSREFGVEVDLRDYGERLILRHDPFGDGEDFLPYLMEYQNKGPIILNIKSERIELRILEMILNYQKIDYFFLDSSFPMIRLLNNMGEKRIAIRFSEFEPIESAMSMAGKVDWVWVDCFTRMPLDGNSYDSLKRHFKICIVSPELQGFPPEKISEFATQLSQFPPEAICTKYPEYWRSCGGIFQ